MMPSSTRIISETLKTAEERATAVSRMLTEEHGVSNQGRHRQFREPVARSERREPQGVGMRCATQPLADRGDGRQSWPRPPSASARRPARCVPPPRISSATSTRREANQEGRDGTARGSPREFGIDAPRDRRPDPSPHRARTSSRATARPSTCRARRSASGRSPARWWRVLPPSPSVPSRTRRGTTPRRAPRRGPPEPARAGPRGAAACPAPRAGPSDAPSPVPRRRPPSRRPRRPRRRAKAADDGCPTSSAAPRATRMPRRDRGDRCRVAGRARRGQRQQRGEGRDRPAPRRAVRRHRQGDRPRRFGRVVGAGTVVARKMSHPAGSTRCRASDLSTRSARSISATPSSARPSTATSAISRSCSPR